MPKATQPASGRIGIQILVCLFLGHGVGMEQKDLVGDRAAPGNAWHGWRVVHVPSKSLMVGRSWQEELMSSLAKPGSKKLRIGPKASRKPEAKPAVPPDSSSSALHPSLGKVVI